MAYSPHEYLERLELLDEIIWFIIRPREENGFDREHYMMRYHFWSDWYKDFSTQELRDILVIEQDIFNMDNNN